MKKPTHIDEKGTHMDGFEKQLNELLVSTYHSIEEIEEKMVKEAKSLNLTINELHLLEAVGDDDEQGRTVSEISERAGLSLPTVTLAVNKLVQKGFVEKRKSNQDGRMVHVTLTRHGRKANRAHQYFHHKMASAVASEMTDEEKAALVKGIEKLNGFLGRKLAKGEKNT